MSMVEHNFLVNSGNSFYDVGNFEVFMLFGSIKGSRPSRYRCPGALTNACATLVKVDFYWH